MVHSCLDFSAKPVGTEHWIKAMYLSLGRCPSAYKCHLVCNFTVCMDCDPSVNTCSGYSWEAAVSLPWHSPGGLPIWTASPESLPRPGVLHFPSLRLCPRVGTLGLLRTPCPAALALVLLLSSVAFPPPEEGRCSNVMCLVFIFVVGKHTSFYQLPYPPPPRFSYSLKVEHIF